MLDAAIACFDAFTHCYMVFDLDKDKAALLKWHVVAMEVSICCCQHIREATIFDDSRGYTPQKVGKFH